MKVAIAISGLPRKVEEGYNQFWKQIIEKYNTDVYLHFWEDEQYEKILSLYSPKKYISEKPFSFADYVNGLEADESLSRPTKPYNVAGNFRGFPMMHGWQKVCELVEGDYDYIIRGRYDLGGYCNLENVDPNKINVSAWHWGGSEICDDNLYVSNSDLYRKIHYDAFDNLIEDAVKLGRIYFQEKNFTRMIDRKGLYDLVVKQPDLKFDLLRENKLWLISHRGNTNGKFESYENEPMYIDKAISEGFDVEVDVWMIEGVLLLGHDKPQYGVTQYWFNERYERLWVHCKNVEAMEWFNMIGGFNYFWHEEDTLTLTSMNVIWAYPGKQPIKGSIAVMPEINNDDLDNCIGICSDYINDYK